MIESSPPCIIVVNLHHVCVCVRVMMNLLIFTDISVTLMLLKCLIDNTDIMTTIRKYEVAATRTDNLGSWKSQEYMWNDDIAATRVIGSSN
jgi:hypothetical protein